MRRGTFRLLAFVVSTAVTGGLAAWWWHVSGWTDGVVLVELGEDVRSILAERAAAPAPEGSFEILPASGLRREPIPEDVARILFPSLQSTHPRIVPDPHAHYRNRAGFRGWTRFDEHPDERWLVVVNGAQLRNDEEVPDEKPDLRILVTGDSHTEGRVPNRESFPNVLAARLRERHPGRTVEGWNAGGGGYAFYQYLGILEKYAPLEPDLFVVAVYTGNDFHGSLLLYRYFEREAMPERPNRSAKLGRELRQTSKGLFAQAWNQASYLWDLPDDADVMLRAACGTTAEMRRLCEERGIAFVVVLIPSLLEAQRDRIRSEVDAALSLYGRDESELSVMDDLVDRYVACLRAMGVESIDLRATFRAHPEPLYWFSDHHLSTRGHEMVADALLPVAEALLRE